jgi:hypothetical protein
MKIPAPEKPDIALLPFMNRLSKWALNIVSSSAAFPSQPEPGERS